MMISLRHPGRVPGAAESVVETVQFKDFPVRELEVEDPRVLGDPFRMRGLGNDDESVLYCPPEKHLGVGAAALPRDRCYARIVEPPARGQRGVRFELDPAFPAQLEKVALVE